MQLGSVGPDAALDPLERDIVSCGNSCHDRRAEIVPRLHVLIARVAETDDEGDRIGDGSVPFFCRGIGRVVLGRRLGACLDRLAFLVEQ